MSYWLIIAMSNKSVTKIVQYLFHFWYRCDATEKKRLWFWIAVNILWLQKKWCIQQYANIAWFSQTNVVFFLKCSVDGNVISSAMWRGGVPVILLIRVWCSANRIQTTREVNQPHRTMARKTHGSRNCELRFVKCSFLENRYVLRWNLLDKFN